MDPYDPDAIFYSVTSANGFGSLAYQNWTVAVALGADFHDLNGDGVYDPNVDRPDILGDRISWCVINDGTDMSIRSQGLQTLPMGLEIYQQVWAFARADELGNVVFFRYRLINADTSDVDDFIFSIWADPDIGEATDDLIGCDTTLSLGYIYNNGPDDGGAGPYGTDPPAFGVDFFQGPVVESPGDSAFLFRGPWFGIDTLLDMRNLPMTAYTFYNNAGEIDSFPSPSQNAPRARLYQEGGFNGHGGPIFPPNYGTGGQPTDPPRFFYPGDPFAGTGWRDSTEADKRFLVNTGPFQLPVWEDLNGNGRPEPGEPGVQDIVIAYMIGQGADAFESVKTLKEEVDEFAQLVYNNNYLPVAIGENNSPLISGFKLYQNYPNPFNPSTMIRFDLHKRSQVQIEVFNVLGEKVAVPVNNTLKAGGHIVQFDAQRLPSGVYFYRLSGTGFSQTKKMVLMR
jgi:hypothetical protein